MALELTLNEQLAQEFAGLDKSRDEPSPTNAQKIGRFTVASLILNRTIGSGIFVAPRLVLLGTGSPGISIILWALGGLIMTCGLVVFLEFGLTVPQRLVPGGRTQPVPRSGGEKNYLEYLLQRPRFLATCMYGIAFLILGNLSGNAVAFGTYVLSAAGIDDAPRSWNIGIAIAATTASCLIHVFSRRGGIILSNFFAVIKVLILLVIVILGLAIGGGAKIGSGHSNSASLSPSKAFVNHQTDLPDFTFSLFYVIYTYSGFEQPFYVLGEVRSPRRIFPTTTLWTMGFTTILFVLVNVAYICVVPASAVAGGSDMATLFFAAIFGEAVAPRVLAAVVAVCIAGNIIVMTFTAARVKQEIAKEGVIPFSLFFATGRITPDAWLRQKFAARRRNAGSSKDPGRRAAEDLLFPERTPVGALLLHWILSVVVIGATGKLTAATAYTVLVFLYSYVMIALVGLFVGGGLLWLYVSPTAKWHQPDGPQGFRPWGGPLCAIIYTVSTLFVIITAFLRPTETSVFRNPGLAWFVLPTIGLSSVLWGCAWWLGLHAVMRRRGLQLVVTRVPHIEWDGSSGEGQGSDSGSWVQRSEVIVRVWMDRRYARNIGGGQDSETDLARQRVVVKGGTEGAKPGVVMQGGQETVGVAEEGAFGWR